MIINYKRLINKEVVYGDEMLPLSNFDKDTEMSTVFFMEEFEIQNCVEKLFEKYPSLIIDTLLYSRNHKRLYVYADQPVEIFFTEYRNQEEYIEVHSKNKILDALNPILEDTKTYSKPDYYSLVEVSEALKSVYTKYEAEEHKIKRYLDYEIARCFGRRYFAVVYSFKYEYDNTLNIGVTTLSKSNEYSFTFQKNGNNIFLKNSNYYDSDKVTSCIYDEISQLFELKQKYKDYLTSYGWRPLANSKATAFLSLCSVSLDVRTEFFSSKLFEANYSFYSNDYETKSISMSVAKMFRGKEESLFKKAYIARNDLPEYLVYELENMPKGIKKFFMNLI